MTGVKIGRIRYQFIRQEFLLGIKYYGTRTYEKRRSRVNDYGRLLHNHL